MFFGLTGSIPGDVKLISHGWIFTQKENDHDQIHIFKILFVVQEYK